MMVQITVVGKALTGKTTLINSICGKTYDDTHQFFVSYRQHTIKNTTLEFFDTKEVNDSLVVDIYCKNSKFVFLTYDLNNKSSLNYIIKIYHEIITTYSTEKLIFILGNSYSLDETSYDEQYKFITAKCTKIENILFFDFNNVEDVKNIIYPVIFKDYKVRKYKTRECKDITDGMVLDDCCNII